MTFLNTKNYTQAGRIVLLTIAFFAIIFTYDRVQRLSYLEQNNLSKYQKVEDAYQNEMILIKDLNFDTNTLNPKTSYNEKTYAEMLTIFSELQLKHDEMLSDYEKFLATKDINQKKAIISKANTNSVEFVKFSNSFYKEKSQLTKEVIEYNQQIENYNNYINTFPNYIIAKTLDYAKNQPIY